MAQIEDMQFVEINSQNESWVSRIFAGSEAQYWVHYNTYWLENSRRIPGIVARLIEVKGEPQPVGFIAYGQHFRDEDLTEPLPSALEIIHMVIDEPYQRRGFGRQATLQAIQELRDWPGKNRILIAHNPENLAAQRLYESLGFVPCGQNYDGDPLLEYQPGKKA